MCLRSVLYQPRLDENYAIIMGHIPTPEELKERYRVDEVRYTDELQTHLRTLSSTNPTLLLLEVNWKNVFCESTFYFEPLKPKRWSVANAHPRTWVWTKYIEWKLIYLRLYFFHWFRLERNKTRPKHSHVCEMQDHLQVTRLITLLIFLCFRVQTPTVANLPDLQLLMECHSSKLTKPFCILKLLSAGLSKIQWN